MYPDTPLFDRKWEVYHMTVRMRLKRRWMSRRQSRDCVCARIYPSLYIKELFYCSHLRNEISLSQLQNETIRSNSFVPTSWIKWHTYRPIRIINIIAFVWWLPTFENIYREYCLKFMKNFHRNNSLSTTVFLCCFVVMYLSCEMYVEQYYQIIRLAFKILGLWPYEQSFFVLVQKVLFTVTLLTFIIAQVCQILLFYLSWLI